MAKDATDKKSEINENLTMSAVPSRLTWLFWRSKFSVRRLQALPAFLITFFGTTDFLPWQFYDSWLVSLLSVDMDLVTI